MINGLLVGGALFRASNFHYVKNKRFHVARVTQFMNSGLLKSGLIWYRWKLRAHDKLAVIWRDVEGQHIWHFHVDLIVDVLLLVSDGFLSTSYRTKLCVYIFIMISAFCPDHLMRIISGDLQLWFIFAWLYFPPPLWPLECVVLCFYFTRHLLNAGCLYACMLYLWTKAEWSRGVTIRIEMTLVIVV